MKVYMCVLLAILACQGASDEPQPTPYTVTKGDTLFLIAKRHGTTVDALRRTNDLQGDLIEIGQVLLLPADHMPSTKAPPTTKKRMPKSTPKPQGRVLTMPSPEPCLTGPTTVDAEHGMAASEGISLETARRVLNTHVPKTLPCFDDYAGLGTGTATFDIHVACTGVVSHVELDEMNHWPASLGDCIAQKMRFADFPPHALPDGDVVRYPLTYTPPAP